MDRGSLKWRITLRTQELKANITKREKIEAALSESEALHRGGAIKVLDMKTEEVIASIDTPKNMGFNPNCFVLPPKWNDLAGH